MMPRGRSTTCGIAAVALCSTVFAAVARAQSPTLPGRVAVSAAFGLFRPIDSAMTDVYGTSLRPLTAQVDVRLVPDAFLFGGIRWVSADGHAVIVGTPITSETSATSLDVVAFRIGAEMAKAVGSRWTLAAGAGVVMARYEERWPDAGLTFNNHSNGFVVLAEARYALHGRWGVVGRVEYSTTKATVADASGAVNLGGVDASAGVRFVF